MVLEVLEPEVVGIGRCGVGLGCSDSSSNAKGLLGNVRLKSVVSEVDTNDGESVSVRFDGAVATVTASVAETVSVVADPSPPPRIALPEQLVLGRERYGR